MRRRDFIKLLGGASAAWPLAAAAQQSAMPVIGYLSVASRNDQGDAAFRRGLADAGFNEGRNVVIEYRWAEGQHDRLPPLAAELVSRRVNLIAAMGGSSSSRAATAATATIPIVFVMGDTDPVQAGIVRSLSEPGGNITGASLMGGAIGVKRVGLMRDLVRNAAVFAILANPKNQYSRQDVDEVEAAVRSSGLRPIVLQAGDADQFDAAFASMAQARADALIVTADPFFTLQRTKLIALAARYTLPAIYQWRFFPVAGGLMSYGASIADANRQAGNYAGRILKGEKPANLPVVLPTKFEFVINLKTAKALGLEIPSGLLAIADEVID